jgi:hypothetical protein
MRFSNKEPKRSVVKAKAGQRACGVLDVSGWLPQAVANQQEICGGPNRRTRDAKGPGKTVDSPGNPANSGAGGAQPDAHGDEIVGGDRVRRHQPGSDGFGEVIAVGSRLQFFNIIGAGVPGEQIA